ncbi:hypothetical protein K2173_005934 [Erythroxylum novogranatense]|uniref:Uncharacterized protein n=1 Tax=Erythroxylum novogranatense TaxID=1862640 RepID=A0AAV8TVG2_9ROSI|nr:hypothetical protein K2173_005934 [Erythroxylum novogranatense]
MTNPSLLPISHPSLPQTLPPRVPAGGHKSLAAAANLANLLPTGTVLAFQALVPSFSNNGECNRANEYLTLGMVVMCSLACFLSSFTDSFIGKDGQLYYGMATFNGMFLFNDMDSSDGNGAQELDETEKANLKLTAIDFVQAIGSLSVFLAFALSSSEVQDCFFPKPGPNQNAWITNLPLAAGLLGSFVFMIFPTKRKGIGCAERAPR